MVPRTVPNPLVLDPFWGVSTYPSPSGHTHPLPSGHTYPSGRPTPVTLTPGHTHLPGMCV